MARLGALLLGCAGAVAQTLPVAPVRDVVDHFYGTEVHDPYRYFEDIKSPEVAAWMKAHSDAAHATLARIAGRDALLRRLTEMENASAARVALPVRTTDGRLFYEKRGASDNQYKLYVREQGGQERLLVDPEALARSTGKPHAVNYFMPSRDGRYLAYGISAGGSEAASLVVLDVRSGKAIGKPISRADFGLPDWSADGRYLSFMRLQALRPGAPPTDKYKRGECFVVDLHSGRLVDKPVFGYRARGTKIADDENPFVELTADGRWTLGVVANGVQRELRLYVAPQAAALRGTASWREVATTADAITAIAYHGNTLYALSHKDASRFKLLQFKLDAADAGWREILPVGERVLTDIAAASDALYIEERDGNIKRLFKRAYADEAKVQEVALPLQGAFSLSGFESNYSAASPRLPGVLLSLESWTRAGQIYQVAADGSVTNTGLQPAGPFDAPSDVEATEVLVKSYDGALVPLSIVHRKDVKLDGNNPTILYGYASYGITEEPFFSTGVMAWLQAGGVYAFANPRGSGVYGEDWYKAGKQANKPNTWKDFIACAEYLIAQRYTSPLRLGIYGGSAGGILVGRTMTERPDLFAAAVSAVGLSDAVRAEIGPNGPPNVPEFGSVKTEAGFRALLEMSTYHHIVDGVKYPAVMFTHGINDPRVEVWQSTKTAARLMAATASGKPVLLRLDYQAGHGIGNTKEQRLTERADVYAFFLWRMGVPGFELKDSGG
ncbi:MAG TPA: prolyl oligopeptidase family serine peptidase [Methylibium sp.]